MFTTGQVAFSTAGIRSSSARFRKRQRLQELGQDPGEVCGKTGLKSRGLSTSISNFGFLIQMNFSCCFFPCGARDRTQASAKSKN